MRNQKVVLRRSLESALGTTIGVVDTAASRSMLQRHLQGRETEFGIDPLRDGPADDPA